MGLTALACRRRDAVGAAYVEAAIKISGKLGKDRAESLLRLHGIGDAVIGRVLAGQPRTVRRRD